MNRLIALIVFAALCLSLPAGFKRVTHGFRLAKMRLGVAFRSDWDIAPLDEQEKRKVVALLNQPFSYLDRGAQCYVFTSRDGKWVLKLFRYDQPAGPLRIAFRHLVGRQKQRASFDEKIDSLFAACRTAYERAKEETGLVFLHLNVTEGQFPIVQIKTPLGQTYALPLDRYRFALQKKASPLHEVFSQARRTGDLEEVREKVQALIELFHKRLEKGIANSDPNIGRNIGFLADRAVEFDFGNFVFRHEYLNDPALRSQEMDRLFLRLHKWMRSFAPEWAFIVEEEKNRQNL